MATVSRGQKTLTDLNDAIISGTPPLNPTTGALWIDESTSPKLLKKWSGTAWLIIGEVMDDGTGDTIVDIIETLGNMANDNLIDFNERQIINDKLADILGHVQDDALITLPTIINLDTGSMTSPTRSTKGTFYTLRKNAQVAGLSITDVNYVDLATKYNALKAYLEAFTPVDSWDLRAINSDKNIVVVKSTFRTNWLNYYNAELALANAIADRLKRNVDEIKVGGTNYASNGNFEIMLNKGLWNASYVGQIKEIVDISTETPPFKYAYHVKNTSNANGGIFTPVIWDGASAEAMVNATLTISYWIKYSNIVQGVGTWNLGRFGELVIEGSTSTGAKVYTYPMTGIGDYNYVSGSNAVWQKVTATHVLSLPATAVKLSKISFKHGLESCVGEFWTTGIKIEIGNKATDWSESPYDINNRMALVEFEIGTDSIISKVTGSPVVNNLIGGIAQEKANNIKIGGRNLFNQENLTSWVLPVGGTSTGSFTKAYSDGYAHTKATRMTTNGSYRFRYTLYKPLDEVVSYSLSFWYKALSASSFNVAVNDLHFGEVIETVATSTWKKVTFTKIVSTYINNLGFIQFDPFKASDYIISDLKLEKGSIATDYTPAPEDVQANIDSKTDSGNFNETTESINNQIGEVAEGLKQKAEQEDLLNLTGQLDIVNGDITETIQRLSMIEQTAGEVKTTITTITETVNENATVVASVSNHMRFSSTGLEIGKSDSDMKVNITNSEIQFQDNGAKVTYINGQKLYITEAEVLSSLIIANHKFDKTATSTTITWVGGGN